MASSKKKAAQKKRAPRRIPNLTPIGGIIAFAGAADDKTKVRLQANGWLLCDGSAIYRAGYAALFGLIGVTYGAGDGDATFNLPDLRGRVVMGAGEGMGVSARRLGARVGEEAHALAGGELPGHLHGGPSHSHRWLIPGGGADFVTGGQHHTAVRATDSGAWFGAEQDRARPDNHGGYSTEDAGTGLTGGPNQVEPGSPHNIIQPSLVLNYIIKY